MELLIVDDDDLDRLMITRALRSAERPFAITEVAYGDAALNCLAQHLYHLVLLDYHLPDADGLHIVQSIRSKYLHLPIIVLTGHGDERTAVALMKAGATDYLSKHDLLPSRLLQTIATALRLSEAEAQAEMALYEGFERLRFQHETSQVLAASLDPLTILANLTRLVVARMADWCAIRLVHADGSYAAASLYPEPIAESWSAQVAAQLGLEAPLAFDATVFDHGEALTFPLLSGRTRALAVDDQPKLEQLQVGSLLCVPITSYNQLVGTITLVRNTSAPAFHYLELALVQDLAQRLAVALHNATLYRQSQLALKLRDEFISLAAHELRTPLTSLLGYVQLLEKNLCHHYDLAERELRMLRTVSEQGFLLNERVKRLIDLSYLKTGEFTLARRSLDLAACLRYAVAAKQATCAQHRIELNLPDHRLLLLGDEQRLTQAVEHLIQNAVQYSPTGGTIMVQATVFGPWVHITVTDQGIGIPSEALSNLFHRFYRAKNADELAISGIGLGLYIVKEIMAQHGGVVEVQSTVGEGSRFTVRLPLLVEP
ncbi:MAG: ATP-binding protein [Oscillochloridaceae bacterium umkhey_bin13]